MSGGTKDMSAVSLFIPRSSGYTSENKTGYWRFIQPGYREKSSPCTAACPCATDIPRVEMLAARGRFPEAWRAILAENPLPGVCGRVCFHPCESSCNRAELDAAVSINAVERFLADAARSESGGAGLMRGEPRGANVAIIGSGPAGLSAGYFLALLGYGCEIFEAQDALGGVLRYGIPAYRLPPEPLDADIARIAALGVSFRAGTRVDAAFLSGLRGRFDAVVVASGHGKALGLGIEGAEHVADALGFLAEVRSGSAMRVAAGSAPVVLGGGNTAIDAARTLRRLGASPIIVYRRRREDMPAFGGELEDALAEGVRLLELRSPLALFRDGEGYRLRLQLMRAADAGADGRARVLPLPGQTEEMRASAVYAAIGAEASEAWMLPAEGSAALQLGRAAFDPKGLSGLPTAYGGDLVTDTESVADAIASGKEAAIALDAFFRKGEASVPDELARCRGAGGSVSMEAYLGGGRTGRSPSLVGFADINIDYFEPSRRGRAGRLSPAAAAGSFAEVALGLDAGAAMAEAERCFNCGICNGCDNCRTFCPEVAVLVDGAERRIDLDYCKGCGICAAECPRNAMEMEEPTS